MLILGDFNFPDINGNFVTHVVSMYNRDLYYNYKADI